MYGPKHRRRRTGGPLPLPWVLVLVSVAGVAAAGYEYRAELAAFASGRPSPSTGAPPSARTPSVDERPDETDPRPVRRRRLVLHGTGDVNVDPTYIPVLAQNGYAYAWSGLRGLFRQDDLTVINLECPVSDLGTIIPKEFSFRCDPDALPSMRNAGVEVANLGNNHAYDFGPDALVDSLTNLRRAGITPVGAGADVRSALMPALVRIGGWRIAVLGFGLVVDPFPESVAGPGKPGVAGGHDTEAMVLAIERAERRADVTIVTIHWGVELDTEPRPEQVALGRRLVRAGADVIFGHHAHRLQPVDTYRDRPIFWGLGNFVWPNFSIEGATTAVARVVLERDGDVRGRLLPAFIEAPGHPVLTEP